MSEPRAELTEAEVDSLTECECGHWANEHSTQGCLATVEQGEGVGEHEDQRVCFRSPEAINRYAVESILAARLAARDAEWRQAIEALPDQMAESWGHGASWLTTGTTVAAVVGDWLRALVREVTGDDAMSLTKGQDGRAIAEPPAPVGVERVEWGVQGERQVMRMPGEGNARWYAETTGLPVVRRTVTSYLDMVGEWVELARGGEG